jgi:tetratricopeptide (TPR) repeat protein
MSQISDAMQAQVDQLCAQGDVHADLSQFSDALNWYWAAWDLLPEPKIKCQAATSILAAVGDANFLGRDFIAGRDNLCTVMHCPGAIGIPFLHLRLGQCQYELGEHAKAIDELMRAYLGGGAELFDEEDPKYLDYLEANLPSTEAPRKSWQFWR